MNDFLIMDDIVEDIRPRIYKQDYSLQTNIDGVKLFSTKIFEGEEGDFAELIRINDAGEMESLEGFKLKQINRTRLFPNSIKAWHVHLKQNEMWYTNPTNSLLVGLWDLRKNSPTTGKMMRIPLGASNAKLLYIPRGVAHGSANFSGLNIQLYYFVDQRFDINDPDEKRINWDAKGADFWKPVRD